jgi:hypothetical protein
MKGGDNIKFIFPHNYKYSTKLFGIIDYSTILFNIILWIIIYFIINIFIKDITIKIYLFIILCFPFFLISAISFYHENIVYVFFYILNFIKKRKIYIFKKY